MTAGGAEGEGELHGVTSKVLIPRSSKPGGPSKWAKG